MESTIAENVCCKAPAGGATSVINGQFYEGGKFMPVHGLYCGKGRNRIAATELAKYVRDDRRIVWDEQYGFFRLQMFVDSNGRQWWQNTSHAASVKTLSVWFR